MLEIGLLGGFKLLHQQRLLDTVKPGKPQLLLAYLLLHRNQWLARARLAFTLWPDSTEEQARTNLRRELHGLRQALPQGYVQADARQLAWLGSQPYRLDVAEFEATGDPALYAGELLPGYYPEWLLDERERLARRYRESLENHLCDCERNGRWREAAEAARRLIAVDPADEEFHRRLIRVHLAEGNPARAEQALRECQKCLREELEVEVSQATLQLFHPLPEGGRLTRLGPPLLGRDIELAQLRSAQPGQLILLLGEPGIGKSRLLAELEPAPRLCARGYEAERSRPFGPWLEALRDHPTALTLLKPEATQKGRDMLFDPVVEWLRGQPASWLVMDDLQWFDESSLALLHYAVRLLSGSPFRWAAAARLVESESHSPLREFLRGLRRSGQLCELRLQPLEPDTIARLVAWADPNPPTEAARRSGGNPLFALELARSDGQGLEASIRERLEAVSGIAREIVSWAAALGKSFAPTLLEKLLGRGLFELLPALEELEAHRILLPNESGYDFGHDVVRELAYQHLSPPRRRLIHLQIARVLQDAPENWAELARHATLAQEHALAGPANLSAAQRSLRLLAFSEASAFASQGLRHARQLSDSGRLQVQLLHAELLAGLADGRRLQLAQELKELLKQGRGQPQLEAAAYEVLSELAFAGHNDADVEEYAHRLAERVNRSAAVEAARWLAHSGNCLASIGRDMDRAEALLVEAEDLAGRCQLSLVDLPLGWGLVEQHRGRWTEADRCLRHALQLSRQLGEPWWRAQCVEALARMQIERDEFGEIEALAAEMEEVVPKLGEGSEAAFAQSLRALAAQARSDAEATAGVEQALASLRRADARRALAFVARRAAVVALRQGDLATARPWAAQALQEARDLQHADEMVLCRAVLCEAFFQLPDTPAAQEELLELRKEARCHPLGALARQALERLRRRWGGKEAYGTGNGGKRVHSGQVGGTVHGGG